MFVVWRVEHYVEQSNIRGNMATLGGTQQHRGEQMVYGNSVYLSEQSQSQAYSMHLKI